MFYNFLWSDPDPAKRFGSDRIRLRNTATGTTKIAFKNRKKLENGSASKYEVGMRKRLGSARTALTITYYGIISCDIGILTSLWDGVPYTNL